MIPLHRLKTQEITRYWASVGHFFCPPGGVYHPRDVFGWHDWEPFSFESRGASRSPTEFQPVLNDNQPYYVADLGIDRCAKSTRLPERYGCHTSPKGGFSSPGEAAVGRQHANEALLCY